MNRASDLWGLIKQINIGIMGVSEGEKRKKEQGIFKEIMAENVKNLMEPSESASTLLKCRVVSLHPITPHSHLKLSQIPHLLKAELLKL